jgi:glutamine phosphoribosylpyrophosphate amidotransferase
MCVIIFKPAGVEVTEEVLRRGWRGNPDGAGFSFARTGKLSVSKGHMKLEDFMDKWNANKTFIKDVPALIHFRIRTDGLKSSDNTHPFTVGAWRKKKPETQGVMAHNGCIWQMRKSYSDPLSDTRAFVEEFGKDFDKHVVDKSKYAIADHIGMGNKLAFLYADGSHIIINEKQGLWWNDMWLSNSGPTHP